jgi:signal transduction histidine kinase
MTSFRSRGLLTGFAMVFATLLVTAAISFLNVQRLYQFDQIVEQTHEAVSELRLLLSMVADAESGMRGFVITSEESYLEPYEAAQLRIPASLDRIQKLTTKSERQIEAIAELRKHVDRRLNHMAKAISTTRSNGTESGRAEVAAGEGQDAMEDVRNRIHDLAREEARMLAARVKEANVRYWTAVVSSLLSAVIGLCLAGLGFIWTNRYIKAREQRTQDLTEANVRLEERVTERTAAISAANESLRQEIEERLRAEKTVRQVADELKRSNRELEQFAAVASHDLQEPLRKIQAFGDRLYGQIHDQLDDKGRDYLDRILASAGRMRALIDGLLEFSRVSTRIQPLVPVDLGQVAHEVVSDLDGRLQLSRGKVEIDELPTLSADPLQMRQLLQNLIGNALKFQRPDVPPLVRVSSRIVSGPSSDGDNESRPARCELIVTDNGVGFDSAYSEQIFELFQRLHGRDQYEGTGMGLAICKKIAERHGGSISVTSTPGQGSRFVVQLPVASPPSILPPA